MTSPIRVGEVSTLVTSGLNPQAFPDRIFAHYSIPAYDTGAGPSLDLGSSIKSQKTRIPNEVVLISKLNPRIPRVWLVRDNQTAQRICSTEFVPILPDTQMLDAEYLRFALLYSLSVG